METSLDEEYRIPGTRSVAVDKALRAQPKSKGPMDRFVTLEAWQRIATYGVGFKPPSMHELRTWILKEEVGCIIVDEENRLANLFLERLYFTFGLCCLWRHPHIRQHIQNQYV
ncbi:unnamed protein product [Prunus brigantina]